jgi:5'-phosphate synthase pdxT subunit
VTAAPTVGVLALQGDVSNHERLLQQCGAVTRRVRLPDELAGLQGLVIPGGESTAMWRLAEDFDLLEPVRSRIRDGLPAFGACAGMIMLADRILDGRPDQRTFGGLDVVVRRNAFGRQVQSFEADLEVAALGPKPFRAVFIRAPWVERVGTDVAVLATVGDAAGVTHPVAVRQAGILATSFHPELTDDTRLHRFFLEQVLPSGC